MTIYITHDLYSRFTSGDGSQNPLTLADLERGRALRGLKHLIERIRESGPESKLVLTLGDTQKEGQAYFVNFDEYRQSTQGRFFDLYRNTGQEASLEFLGEHFPDEFEQQSTQLSERDLRAAETSLSKFVVRRIRKSEDKDAPTDSASLDRRRYRKEQRLSREQVEAVESLRSQSAFLYYAEVVEELRARLASDQGYPEVSGPESWQRWIYRNSWLFGPMYLEPIDRQRIGFEEIPDFLFPTLDGFIDILEIKLPSKNVIVPPSSHPNAYTWSQDTNRAIGQVVNYIQQMAINQLLLSQKITRAYSERLSGSVTVLRPRAFILIGNESGWTASHREAYRSLNYSLHGIEGITYDELLRRGEQIIGLYSS